MTPEQTERLQELQGPWCTSKLFKDLYGIDLHSERKLSGAFKAWVGRFRPTKQAVRHARGAEFNRHEFENFLQGNGLVPFKWGAVELGMAEGSLRQTLDAIVGEGLPVRLSSLSDQIIEQEVVRDLYKSFLTTRYRNFSSHSAKCAAIHEAIRSEYEIEIKPLHCVTSQILQPDNPDYATAFDAITLEPIGLRYQVWLDFKKPVNLQPDCCSLKFFAQERKILEQFRMRGDEPEIPEALLAKAS